MEGNASGMAVAKTALPAMVARRLQRLTTITYMRYIGASVMALAVDILLFLTTLAAHVAPVPASVIGYSAGIAVHWLISTRFVFTDGRSKDAAPTRVRLLMFILSAGVGLAATSAIVALAQYLHADPKIGKLVAIGVSFQAVYLIRKYIIFR